MNRKAPGLVASRAPGWHVIRLLARIDRIHEQIEAAPTSDGRIEITIERLPNGEVSPYLTQEVMVGDELELRGPIGGWFVWRSDQREPIQLVAGGSGIVPLMGMIRSRALANSTIRTTCYTFLSSQILKGLESVFVMVQIGLASSLPWRSARRFMSKKNTGTRINT
jgi:NAD(P)H-flavin reductase